MTSSSRILTVACAAALFFVSGCQIRQDMADQPKYKPLAPTDFFADGRSERPAIANTVARGALDEDALFVSKDSNAFPIELTPELMKRGKDRYGIFCTPCHGLQGDGNGMVAMRGMKHPPTYHSDRLRKVPNGYLFDVITNGFGGMLSYSAQIPPRDRWAIIAYVRALQLSRNAPVSELPSELRDKLNTSTSGGATK
jgi:mono/diheme cytochrome c family protein